MKLGVSTFAYTWSFGWAEKVPAVPMNALSFLRKAADMGARVVQIADNVLLTKLSKEERGAILRQADSYGILVEVGMRGLFEDNVLAYLDVAKEFRSPVLRIVTDTPKFKPSPEEVVTIVRRLKAPLEKARIALAIENHDRFDAPTLASIMKTVDSPFVGICLDTVNSFGALEPPRAVIDTLGPFTVDVHLKDFKITRSWHSMGFNVEGEAAGEGRLDVRYLLERLRTFKRDPNVILETWVTPEDTIEGSVRKEQDMTERGFTRMRELIPG